MTKLPALLGVASLFLGLSLVLVAATPPANAVDEASGVFHVGGPAAMFALRVDPWSSGVHQIRGIGRASIEGTRPTDVYFEILGTYLPDRGHEARGLLLYRDAQSTASVPWHGAYDVRQKSLQWDAAVGDRTLALPQVRAFATEAATAVPQPIVGLSSKLPPRRLTDNSEDDDFVNKDGSIDFGKVILAIVELEPKLSSQTPVKPAGKIESSDKIPAATDDMVIIQALTDLGAGKQESAGRLTPKEVLEGTLRSSEPIRKRRSYPPLDAPRVVKTLTKPGLPSSSSPTVPNLVGKKFEDAVNELWRLGLNPASIDCLGPAKDPAQAERVVAQTPPAGSPYPADRNLRLQWYAPMERPPGVPDGFQPTDGPRVDLRFVESVIAANGRAIGKSGIQPKEIFAWNIIQIGEPSLQGSIKDTREQLAKLMAEVKGSDRVTINVTMRRETPGDVAFEFSSHSISNGESVDSTYHHRIFEYRGFVISYYHYRNGLNQPLAAVADTVLENSRRLIDLRFPK